MNAEIPSGKLTEKDLEAVTGGGIVDTLFDMAKTAVPVYKPIEDLIRKKIG
jgi:hypothetical protein